MVTINLEVRLMSDFKNTVEFFEVDKKEALTDSVEMALLALCEVVPEVEDASCNVTPSEQWFRLPEPLYFVKETPESEFFLCVKSKEEITIPTAEMVSIFVTFEEGVLDSPVEISVMPSMAENFDPETTECEGLEC